MFKKFIDDIKSAEIKELIISDSGEMFGSKDLMNKKKHVEDRKTIDRFLTRNDLQISIIKETKDGSRFEICTEAFADHRTTYLRQDGSELHFSKEDYNELIENGLEPIVAKHSISNNVNMVQICEVFEVAGGGTAPKVSNTTQENILIDRSQLSETHIIVKGSVTTSHEGEGKEVHDLEGAILFNSEAYSESEFCRVSIVAEQPHKVTYIGNKVILLKFKRNYSESYKWQLYRYFLNNMNIIRQLQFNTDTSKSRYSISVNTLKRLWVPEENLESGDTSAYDQIVKLEKDRVDIKNKLVVIERELASAVQKSLI